MDLHEMRRLVRNSDSPAYMDAEEIRYVMIKEKIQLLSKLIYESISISLFSELPLTELELITNNVDNIDSLRSRINDICNIIDRINKKEIDKYTNVKTTGSKQTLINLLKTILPMAHDQINKSIENPLDIIFLVRAYYIHGRNKNITKALAYLEIDSVSLDNFPLVWNKIYFLFYSIIDSIIEILQNKGNSFTQNTIDDKTRKMLIAFTFKRFDQTLNMPQIKGVLLYLLSENEILDLKLAEHFNISIDELREDLLCLYPSFIDFKYYDEQSTVITLNKEIMQPLKQFYFNGSIK